ncbi:rhodanese-like domain-containing protein [Ureibacillus acetophenoni]|uniref:Rhodanese-related sulfurtransferase n=1 Tax=Ureibacillus acetophenoni TaxID=614649 RepID=A0A285UM66_9BACL|nr:rhodanese-like domain-containing protein [Ureibacillus acetophenoni]SOC42995.1 rhodanese-related sulfurtransferase [Ureibacillus acetophenoni]
MKRKNKFAVLFGLIVVTFIVIATSLYVSSNNDSETISELQTVDTKMLTKMIDSKENMVIVDLREPELFATSRVPGAINIPFDEIQSRYTELPKDKDVIFVCHTGRMGTESGNLLLENGYKNVFNLEGGIAEWTGNLEK